MAEIKEARAEYFIPDNFAEEGRVFQGKIKIRNLIEALVMAALAAIPGLGIITNISMGMQAKISVMMFFIFPPLLLGVAGFNGDSFFSSVKSAVTWKRDGGLMLYRHRPRLLRKDPLSEMMGEGGKLDDIIEKYETEKRERIDKKVNLMYVEGEDFDFASDEFLKRYTAVGKKTSKKKEPPKEYIYTESDAFFGEDDFY